MHTYADSCAFFRCFSRTCLAGKHKASEDASSGDIRPQKHSHVILAGKRPADSMLELLEGAFVGRRRPCPRALCPTLMTPDAPCEASNFWADALLNIGCNEKGGESSPTVVAVIPWVPAVFQAVRLGLEAKGLEVAAGEGRGTSSAGCAVLGAHEVLKHP